MKELLVNSCKARLCDILNCRSLTGDRILGIWGISGNSRDGALGFGLVEMRLRLLRVPYIWRFILGSLGTLRGGWTVGILSWTLYAVR